LLSFGWKRKGTKGTLSVVIQRHGVELAYVVTDPSGPVLKGCQFVPTTDPKNSVSDIVKAIQQLGAENAGVNLVLPPEGYQIFLVEAPDVSDAEMIDALRWRVKDLLQYSVEDAQLDYVSLPEDAFRGRGRMMYVIAAKCELIQGWLNWLGQMALEPAVIDVPETALLNITAPLCDEEAGTAVLYLSSPSSVLNLMSGQAMYLTRQLALDVQQSEEIQAAQTGNVVLDLQRSLDYYESQIGKPPCVRVLLLPMQVGETALITDLRYNLGLDIHSLDLADVVNAEVTLDIELQQNCLLSIAAAMRNPEKRDVA